MGFIIRLKFKLGSEIYYSYNPGKAIFDELHSCSVMVRDL